jgi:predicted transcriptional regulator
MATVIHLQLDDEIASRLDTLTAALDRPRTRVIEQAIARYLDTEIQFLDAVEEGIRAAEAGELISHEAMVEELHEFQQRVAARGQSRSC